MNFLDSTRAGLLERFLDLCTVRYGLITSNLANIDTPGYRTRDISFETEMRRAIEGLYQGSPAVRDVAGLLERPDGNNVSPDRESLSLAETQLRFRAGVELLRAEFRRLQMAIKEGT